MTWDRATCAGDLGKYPWMLNWYCQLGQTRSSAPDMWLRQSLTSPMTSGDLFQAWKVLVQRLLKYHPYHPVRDGLTITPAESGVQNLLLGGFHGSHAGNYITDITWVFYQRPCVRSNPKTLDFTSKIQSYTSNSNGHLELTSHSGSPHNQDVGDETERKNHWWSLARERKKTPKKKYSNPNINCTAKQCHTSESEQHGNEEMATSN